jgi:hypothetical protein
MNSAYVYGLVSCLFSLIFRKVKLFVRFASVSTIRTPSCLLRCCAREDALFDIILDVIGPSVLKWDTF